MKVTESILHESRSDTRKGSTGPITATCLHGHSFRYQLTIHIHSPLSFSRIPSARMSFPAQLSRRIALPLHRLSGAALASRGVTTKTRMMHPETHTPSPGDVVAKFVPGPPVQNLPEDQVTAETVSGAPSRSYPPLIRSADQDLCVSSLLSFRSRLSSPVKHPILSQMPFSTGLSGFIDQQNRLCNPPRVRPKFGSSIGMYYRVLGVGKIH
jgi:hypothetical protein